jgi:hypothetical protein
MREKPCLADFLSYLEELVDEFGEQPLSAGEIDRLLEVYRRIGEEAGRDSAGEERFRLLTESGTLVEPQDAFYADAPWFQERINHSRVQFLHRGLPVTVTLLRWVRSLASEVTERPMGDRAILESPEVTRRVSKLEALIRSPQFRVGVARLVYHEHGVYQSSIAGWLARASVVAVRELSSELVVTLDGEEVVVGAGPSDQYLDMDGPRIFVDGNAGRLIRTFVSQAINSGLGEHCLQDLSPLADILDCEPAEVDQTLTRLRIKPVDDEGAFARPEDDGEEGTGLDDADEAPTDAGGTDGEGSLVASEQALSDDDATGSAIDGSHDEGPPADAVTVDSFRSRPRPREAGTDTREVPESASRAEGLDSTGAGGETGRPTHKVRAGATGVTGGPPTRPGDEAGAEGRRSPRLPAADGSPDTGAGARSGADGASNDPARTGGGSAEPPRSSAARLSGVQPIPLPRCG